MMKAQIVTKAVDSRTNRKVIRAGAKGKGTELWAATYWPDSNKSVESMERSLSDWLRQHPAVEIVDDEESYGTYGGSRPGAGRKAIDGAVRVTAVLPPELAAKADALGGGNASAGIRKALAPVSVLKQAHALREIIESAGDEIPADYRRELAQVAAALEATDELQRRGY